MRAKNANNPSSSTSNPPKVNEQLADARSKEEIIKTLLVHGQTIEPFLDSSNRMAYGFVIKDKIGKFKSAKVIEIIYRQETADWQINCLNPDYVALAGAIKIAFSDAAYLQKKDEEIELSSDDAGDNFMP